MIPGEVVYPALEEDFLQTNQACRFKDIKQLRIDVFKYKLSKSQIRCWIEIYGIIKGYLEKEVVVDEVDGSSIGTGA
jgi:hypothetical protein